MVAGPLVSESRSDQLVLPVTTPGRDCRWRGGGTVVVEVVDVEVVDVEVVEVVDVEVVDVEVVDGATVVVVVDVVVVLVDVVGAVVAEKTTLPWPDCTLAVSSPLGG